MTLMPMTGSRLTTHFSAHYLCAFRGLGLAPGRPRRRMALTLTPLLLLLLCSCHGKDALPVVPVDLRGGTRMQTITEWRISGPFRLPEKDQTYTEGGAQEAFARDYLT